MSANLASALITKLTVSNRLDSDDIRAIQALRIRQHRLGGREIIVSDGERPEHCCLIVEGFAFRSKTTLDGERQVLSIHIPGEVPDLQSLHLKVMDHDLMTVTPCVLGFISHEDLRHLTGERPNLAAALWRETLIDGSIFREWIVNVGRREALPRMAHLLIELYKRLQTIGYARNGEFVLPITQVDLGDCLGLSVVHTNRVLQHLRRERLLEADRSEFQILDHDKIEALAGFDPTYLHLAPDN
ncbi:Crp/Fnr family transcriptional regulator [Bradyrhizobium sp. NBAIM20]|uniref:Crp/Fnr family transcriptional regulator n=1 Tax=unclassified Bradyrhizobium TaxID=2631580 RepID=UPI001CD6A1B0|nr:MULTISPECIES: Crp/Fnr family transcriptional regulator [unclassified Bradyrhizobium]MCA1411741.1 Crp/Fnr family transcriptional regulator [Bradyrhizobium sp. NBAIM20]MCA1460924.1 Crp/Fnr family transcriptional regulator [Bradyrhizobium sp. NBAIM18]